MPWINYRKTKSGAKIAHLQWRDEAGKIWSESLKTSDERVAEMYLSAKRKELASEKPAPARPIDDPWAALEDFLADRGTRQLSEATIANDRAQLTRLFRSFGDVRMAEWSRRHLVRYIQAHDWSRRTVHIVVGTARLFIRWAADSGVPCPDFTKGYKPRAVRVVDQVPLTVDESRRLLETVRGHHYETAVGLALLAGLEPADFRSLDWAEVDMDGRTIDKARSKSNAPIHGEISEALFEILTRHRALSGPVVRNLPESASSAIKGLRRLYAKAQIPPPPRGHNSWLRLRHTFATRLDEAGAGYATIGRAMGHMPGSKVTARYIHTDRSRIRSAVDHMDAALRGAAT